jgi:hypothetical protein
MARGKQSSAGLGVGLAAGIVAMNLIWTTTVLSEELPASIPPAAVQSTDGTAAPASQAPLQPPANAPAVSPLDGLKIYAQSWRRGGLGSKALMTFTLRNTNDYAVKDIEIVCTFMRRDGSFLTDRKRVIGEAVKMKSRRTFSRVHVGFVNVNAAKAKCAPVAASRT